MFDLILADKFILTVRDREKATTSTGRQFLRLYFCLYLHLHLHFHFHLCLYMEKKINEVNEVNITRLSDAFLDKDVFLNILGITFILNLKANLYLICHFFVKVLFGWLIDC